MKKTLLICILISPYFTFSQSLVKLAALVGEETSIGASLDFKKKMFCGIEVGKSELFQKRLKNKYHNTLDYGGIYQISLFIGRYFPLSSYVFLYYKGGSQISLVRNFKISVISPFVNYSIHDRYDYSISNIVGLEYILKDNVNLLVEVGTNTDIGYRPTWTYLQYGIGVNVLLNRKNIVTNKEEIE